MALQLIICGHGLKYIRTVNTAKEVTGFQNKIVVNCRVLEEEFSFYR